MTAFIINETLLYYTLSKWCLFFLILNPFKKRLPSAFSFHIFYYAKFHGFCVLQFLESQLVSPLYSLCALDNIRITFSAVFIFLLSWKLQLCEKAAYYFIMKNYLDIIIHKSNPPPQLLVRISVTLLLVPSKFVLIADSNIIDVSR